MENLKNYSKRTRAIFENLAKASQTKPNLKENKQANYKNSAISKSKEGINSVVLE